MARVTIILEDIANEDGSHGLAFHLESDPPIPQNISLDALEINDDLATSHYIASHLVMFYKGYIAPQLEGLTLEASVEASHGTTTQGPVATAAAVAKLPNGDYCPFPELLTPATREAVGIEPSGPSITILDETHESQETPPQ